MPSLYADGARRRPAGHRGAGRAPRAWWPRPTRADVVLNAVVGFAGLPVTMAALEAGRRLALANKESLIAGAPVVQKARRTPGAEIVPVDSEHCAVHQCLAAAADPTTVARLLLTASGGPFRGWTHGRSSTRSPSPTPWPTPPGRMGPKITIDSSTLMNKGLEVIEAHELFGISYDRIDIVVHPQSIVHSMVELRDGSTLAQLSAARHAPPHRLRPRMARPLRRALRRAGLVAAVHADLRAARPRRSSAASTWPTRPGSSGGSAPAWLSAANEVAVDAFLAGAAALERHRRRGGRDPRRVARRARWTRWRASWPPTKKPGRSGPGVVARRTG